MWLIYKELSNNRYMSQSVIMNMCGSPKVVCLSIRNDPRQGPISIETSEPLAIQSATGLYKKK